MEFDKLKEEIKKNYIWIIFFIAISIFMAILEDVFEKEIMRVDVLAYKLIVQNLRNDILTPIMIILTNLGSAKVLLTICALSIVIIKDKKIGIAMFCNLMLTSGLNVLVKSIVQRPRPEGYRLITETGYSFPSGHSMASTAFYGFAIYLICKYVKNKHIRNISCTILAIMIPTIAFSRVYLGVHYASDVIGGFLLSFAYLICITKILSKLNKHIDKKHEEKKEQETK